MTKQIEKGQLTSLSTQHTQLISPPRDTHTHAKMSDTPAPENNMLAAFKELNVVEQAAFIRQLAAVHEKTVAAALKDAGKRKRLTPEEREAAKAAKAAKPKREQPPATKAWLDYVQLVHAELKAADPSSKYGQAMQEASRRREAGDAAAPPKAEKPAKVVKAPKAEKAVPTEAKAVKTSALGKPAAPTASPAPAKTVKAAKMPGKASAAAAAPAPAPVTEEADDSAETLQVFKLKGKTYLRSTQNECWLQGPSGSMGAWQGIYNPAKNSIVPAPEPEFE